MLLTRVKEAYYRGVLRLNISNRDDAWPVILRTDGIFMVKPYFSIPTKDGYQTSNQKVSLVKIADLSPEFDIRFCPEVPMAKTTINVIRDGVMQYLGKHELGRDIDEDLLYHVSHNGEHGVIAKRVPEGEKSVWVQVGVLNVLGVPHFAASDHVLKATIVDQNGVTPCSPDSSMLTPDTLWTFADAETKACLFKVASLSEAGFIDPLTVRHGPCKTLGKNVRELSVTVVYSAEKHSDKHVAYPKVSLVAPLMDNSDIGDEIGFLYVGAKPQYRNAFSSIEGTGELVCKYEPASDTVLDLKDLAKLVNTRVWMEDSHLHSLKKREQEPKSKLSPRVVLQTTLLSTTGHMFSIRVLSTENELEMGVYQYRESSHGEYMIHPDDLHQIGKLVFADANTHELLYVPMSAIVPDLERLSMALARPVIMSPDASAANETLSWRSGGFSSMARAQGYGANQHPLLGGWANSTPLPGYGHAAQSDNQGVPRGYDRYQSLIACVSIPNSFYSEVEIPYKHTTRKVRFLGNTAIHLAKAVLTNPGDIYVADGHAWKPLSEDCVPLIDAILSTVGHTIPVEGLVDTWVSGVSVSVSFFGTTRCTTINIPEADGFIRQVTLTTPAAAFINIKKYL